MAINAVGHYGRSGAAALTRQGASSGIAGVPAPVFGPNHMYTRTAQTRSDEVIRQDIVALAKSDAARGVNGFGDSFGRESADYKRLAHEYITPYSPDRKALFAKRMNEIGEGLRRNPFDVHIDNSAMLRMLGVDAGGAEARQTPAGAALEKLIRRYEGDLGGNTLTGRVSMIAFRDGTQRIGSWSATYGWGYQPTEAEVARRCEVANLYLRVWKEGMGIK